MSLNIKNSLEIVKRAGFGPGVTMTSDKPERRMADGQRTSEEEPRLTGERTDSIQAAEADSLDEAFEEIDHHRNPEKMTFDQLLDVNDL